MKDEAVSQLKKELRQTGASQAEAAALATLAAKLPRLKNYAHIKDGSIGEARHRRLVFRSIAGVSAGLATVLAVIVISQAALPTSWLYPVQQLSDNVAVAVHPQYRASVMMKRAQQINTLVANHASSNKILATLADYSTQAKLYKTMPHANYAAFEYCKANLQQAAAAASPATRQAIQSSLQSLEAA